MQVVVENLCRESVEESSKRRYDSLGMLPGCSAPQTRHTWLGNTPGAGQRRKGWWSFHPVLIPENRPSPPGLVALAESGKGRKPAGFFVL